MKSQRIIFTAIIYLAAVLVQVPATPAIAQAAGDRSPFIGRWQINPAKSTFNRYGPNGKNQPGGPTRTLVFSAQGQGLKFEVYGAYPQPAPNRSMSIILDGKPHSCNGDCVALGNTAPDPNRQTYTFMTIDPHMLTRVTYAEQKISEYLVYTVSTDGKIMTQINWSAETPEWQNIYVFEKQP